MECVFFLWSKSFMPVQMGVIGGALMVIYMLSNKLNYVFVGADLLIDKYRRRGGEICCLFIILSIFIGGPFLIKSTYYSGTPFFPLMTGTIKVNQNIDEESIHWNSIMNSSKSFVQAAKSYGYGRSFDKFLNHFWIVAVPDEGVNNEYDYPLGLVYLLVLGPFIVMFFNELRRKELVLDSLFIILFWTLWWLGSQQSRYLYVPVFLMAVKVISAVKPSKILGMVFILAMVLNLLSVFRSHKNDFGVPLSQVLRKKDLDILDLNQKYIKEKRTDMVDLNFRDVPFAQFPVRAVKENLPHTLAL